MISDAIYKLFTTAEITYVSPNYAPQAQELPWIVYHVSSTDPTDTKDGVSVLDKIYLQVDIMHTTYRAMNTTAEAARTVLDGYSGTVTLDDESTEEIQAIRFMGQTDVFEEDPRVHRKLQNYEIRYVR